MQELIFHWGLEGFGAKLYRVTNNGEIRFLKHFSSMDMDENDDEIWRNGEVEYRSFEEYWNEFVSQELWLHCHPVFLHPEYKPFVRDYLTNIPQDSLTKGELLKLMYWFDEIINEN